MRRPFAYDTDSDWACVDANPNLKIDSVSTLHVGPKRLEVLLDRHGRADGAIGVVVVGGGGPEERHHPIAEELVDRALVAVHGVEDDLERSVHHLADVLGVKALRDARESTYVGEEHGHLFTRAFAAKRCAALAAELHPHGIVPSAPAAVPSAISRERNRL